MILEALTSDEDRAVPVATLRALEEHDASPTQWFAVATAMGASMSGQTRYAPVMLLVVSALAGCGDDDGALAPDAAAGSGGSAASSGSGGVGGAGNGGIGGIGGVGGTSGGDSGAGSGGDGGALDAGVDANLDVDLTLGGFNQDLPAPSVDCLTETGLLLGCMAVSGEYNGEAFEMICSDNADEGLSVGNDGRHILGCRIDIAAGDVLVELLLREDITNTPPAAFQMDVPQETVFADVWNRTRFFDGYRVRDLDMFLLAATHDQEFRVAGTSEVVPATVIGRDWRVMGAFALSFTPTSACVADAMGFGCDDVRLRGTFQVYPVGP